MARTRWSERSCMIAYGRKAMKLPANTIARSLSSTRPPGMPEYAIAWNAPEPPPIANVIAAQGGMANSAASKLPLIHHHVSSGDTSTTHTIKTTTFPTPLTAKDARP